jgi:hypothetical protein
MAEIKYLDGQTMFSFQYAFLIAKKTFPLVYLQFELHPTDYFAYWIAWWYYHHYMYVIYLDIAFDNFTAW